MAQVEHIWLSWYAFCPLESNGSWGQDQPYNALAYISYVAASTQEHTIPAYLNLDD